MKTFKKFIVKKLELKKETIANARGGAKPANMIGKQSVNTCTSIYCL